MFIQFRLPSLQDIYPVAFARTVLAPPRTMGTGWRKDTTRAKGEWEVKLVSSRYVRGDGIFACRENYVVQISKNHSPCARNLHVASSPGRPSASGCFELIFHISRTTEYSRQIVKIVLNVQKSRESRRTFGKPPPSDVRRHFRADINL